MGTERKEGGEEDDDNGGRGEYIKRDCSMPLSKLL
jgi:hypothetical protein